MIKIRLVITPEQLISIKTVAPTLYDEIIRATLSGANPEWDDVAGGTAYKFTTVAADGFVPNEILEALFQFGVDETNLSYWSEVPNSSLDNLVPVDWPRSKKIVLIDDVEVEERIQLQDYTLVIPGINGTSLVRCGSYETGTQNYLSSGVDGKAWRDRYKTKFCNLVFHQSLTAWKEANSQVV